MPKSTSLQAPGSFLAQMLEKYKIAPFRLSKDIHMSQSAVRLLVLGKNRITVPVALRLAKYFNTTPESWLTIQMKWEIAEAGKNKDLMNIVKGISLAKKGVEPKKKPVAAKKTVAAKKPAAAGKKAKAKKPAAAKTKR